MVTSSNRRFIWLFKHLAICVVFYVCKVNIFMFKKIKYMEHTFSVTHTKRISVYMDIRNRKVTIFAASLCVQYVKKRILYFKPFVKMAQVADDYVVVLNISSERTLLTVIIFK